MTVGETSTETNYGTSITHQTFQDVFSPPHGH
jgi:hypothetical protein